MISMKGSRGMNSYSPEVSVIIPVFNAGEDLKKFIDSILVQTSSNYEVILIDNVSTDESGQICDQYEKLDERIRSFHIVNSGVSVTRNKGLGESKGKWEMFIDADD